MAAHNAPRQAGEGTALPGGGSTPVPAEVWEPPAGTGHSLPQAGVSRGDRCGLLAGAHSCATCGHLDVFHNLATTDKKTRTACSISDGAKAVPCGCRKYIPEPGDHPVTYPHTNRDCAEHHDLVVDFNGPRPTIVALCGSTRFPEAFAEANLRETLAGKIVLSIGANLRSDHDLGYVLEGVHPDQADSELASVKAELDDLHKRKIDLADEVLVLNVGGYLGASTRSEIEYAEKLGKPVRYLETPAERRS